MTRAVVTADDDDVVVILDSAEDLGALRRENEVLSTLCGRTVVPRVVRAAVAVPVSYTHLTLPTKA